jgi:2-amino-4-hydroxy-6-hydroxymethyldihydropteridine diphosphokinase
VYESAAIGPDGLERDDQDAFLNCVVELETSLVAQALRDATAAIEQHLGRVSRERWQPRPIDIDIILYGTVRIETPTLTIPHPRMHERAFVIRPLLDLDPNIEAPGLGRLSRFLSSVAAQDCRLHTTADEFAG